MPSTPRLKYYLLVALLPFLLLGYLHSQLELERYQLQRPLKLEDSSLPVTAEEVSGLTLNYQTAAADLLWLRGLLYRSERAGLRQPPRTFTQYADVIIEIDPYFHPIYRWHNVFRYRALANPTQEDLDEANRILATGIEYFPGDWTLARNITLNHHNASHLLDQTDQQRIEGLREAVHYAELGAEIDDAPPVMTGLAINFRRRLRRMEQDHRGSHSEDDPAAAVSDDELDFLLRQYFAADDDRQRQFLRNQLLRMGAEEELIERHRNYEDRFRAMHRQRLGYAPPDAYLLVDYHLYDWTQTENL